MNELQKVINIVTGQLALAKQVASYSVLLTTAEAQVLIDAAQLTPLLQERCELLGRAVTAVWSLVSEEDRQAIAGS